ncbi:MAG: vanadium-dependent haloperoxidase [Chitinophagales bacterium]
MDNANSLAGQITDLTALPVVEEGEKYYWPICANEALYNIILNLMPTATAENLAQLSDIYNDFDASFSSIPADIYNRSKLFGQEIAAAVFEYSITDGAHECYLYNFPASYIPPTGDYAWVPTPPAYLNALQPYWGSVRPFVASNVDDAMAVPPYAFSTAPGSTMYKQALDVYNMVEETTPEMTAIALFWADDPGTTFTPPGHAWAIAKQVIDNEDANLGKAALTYGKLGLALHDAFVSCWNNKYIFNLIRPVTYIREYIDADFNTIVDTPPFPEYTSGHSTNMGAFTAVMEDLYGKSYAFEDDSHTGVYPSRYFESFSDAAYEAAISRMYGGIHYKQACVQGVICGRLVGENVNALNWKD